MEFFLVEYKIVQSKSLTSLEPHNLQWNLVATLNWMKQGRYKKNKKLKHHMKTLKHYVRPYLVHTDISSHLPDPYFHVLAFLLIVAVISSPKDKMIASSPFAYRQWNWFSSNKRFPSLGVLNSPMIPYVSNSFRLESWSAKLTIYFATKY